jgi:hypothetical protein
MIKKWIIGSLILVVAVILILIIANQQPKSNETTTPETKPKITTMPESSEDSIVFEMKYVGLSGQKDELRYNSYWGFGGQEEDTPFITELKNENKEISLVYNRNFKGAEYSAVELKDNKPIAFYFDLNADGKVSDNEKILPVTDEESPGRITVEFVTPDFIMNTEDGKKVPFRALLVVNIYNQSTKPNYMWSPSCVLEGTLKINGEPTKMILFANGFTGSFNEFGRCSYYLQNSDKEIGRSVPRQRLSSIINHNGQFYNLKTGEKDETVKVILDKYTGTSGELALKMSGSTDLESELTSAYINGTKDSTIYFNTSGKQDKLPTADYQLNSGYINYSRDDNKWRLNFSEGPEFTINADKTTTIELGKPVLTVSAIDESKRYQNDVKEKTVYSKGTTILLSRKVTGAAGELYGYFWQNTSNNSVSIKPEIKIVDPDGKEVASSEMEYG